DGFNNEFNNNEFNNNEFNNNEFNNNEFNNNEFNDNEFNDNEFNNEQDFFRFGKVTGISTIKQHFEKYHKDIYQQQHQTTLNFPISDPYKKEDLKLKKINDKLIKWIIFDQQPFDVVEDKCFVDLVSELDSRYRLPCHQTISSWIESIFKKQKIVIKKMFNDFSHRVSLTTDAWTSTTTNQGYLGITAHWIDDSWRMKKILLNFIPLNESHTGVYLANKILDTLEEFSLCKKVLAMTTDNGSNMVSLAEHLNNYLIQKYNNKDFMHLRCGAHVLNLAVKEGIKLIDQPIEKLRKTASKELKTIFEMKNQKFLIPDLDISTRWNSLYNMIKKMLRIKDMVDILIAGNRTLLQIYPNEEEWNDIKNTYNLLEPIFLATELLSGSSYPTLGDLRLTFSTIIKGLNEKIGIDPPTTQSLIATAIVIKLDDYWKLLDQNSKISSILDPSHKLLTFPESE
ncbi:3120_t:CDS:2, partial [Entrophospora sp. SA101]